MNDGLNVVAKDSKGNGVVGVATDGHGVLGKSDNGIGLYGISKTNNGVYGSSEGSESAGVSADNLGSGYGVVGRSPKGKAGVYGHSTNSDPNAKSSGIGVKGVSQAGVGVYGESTDGEGIIGKSTTHAGMWGLSQDSTGVQGWSTNAIGVIGRSEEYWGVWGLAVKGGNGVHGESGKVNEIGKYGSGVWGTYNGENNDSQGVLGNCKNGSGVKGESINGSGLTGVSEKGIGIWAKGERFAGYFEGAVNVTGELGINGVLRTPGRMHLEGEELLYLLNKQGVIIGKESGGNGYLTVQGALYLAEGGIHGVNEKQINLFSDESICLFSKKGVVIGKDFDSSGNLTVRGSINVDGDVILASGGADCSEEFDVMNKDSVEQGTVMVINEGGSLEPSQKAYDRCVAGVISGAGQYKPGIVLDKQPAKENRLPIALVGKVYCKVDAQYGEVKVGDLLTTSDTEGYAMKVSDHSKALGSIIGKALRPLNNGQAMIPILIALQ